MAVARPIRVLELRSVRGTGGGPEKTILLGTAATDPARFAITVCYLRQRGDADFAMRERAQACGIDYLEIEERGSLDPAVYPALRRLVRSRTIDIVHAHDYKTDLLAYLVARDGAAVPLATAHGWTGHSARERRLYYPGDRLILSRFPRVIAVSGEIRSALIAAGADPRRVTVVLNGIDETMFRRDARQVGPARRQLGVAPDDYVIGAVGRLEPQKRFDLLIEAFADLHRQRPNLRLVIAGEGSCRPMLEALVARLQVEGACRLLGQYGDVPRLHHALDLLVQSSTYEGTPNVVLEAMALETPVVATDAGGTAELVRDGIDGVVVPAGDVQALTRAMSGAIEHPADARTMAREARARVERDLSFRARMAKVEAIYEQLMRPRIGVSGGVACTPPATL